MQKKEYLAIIPARKGSKRLPNKNIKNLGGHPLISWTIRAALDSKYLNDVMVSTDSVEIAEISKHYGASIPFIRPDHLAKDDSSSFDVVKHVIDFYKNNGIEYENIVLLQPTSPLRTSNEIDNAIEMQVIKNANSITSVCEVDHSPLWTGTIPIDNSMRGFLNLNSKVNRSKDLETYYRLNGAIYIVKTSRILEEKSFISQEKSFAFKMGREQSVDIDTILDFKLASLILQDHED
ncbi:MAG TPA: CMP-N-acetlyneuraminic acid synthetase [Bacteroidales bacterium]|nr:CMP-N-acetlyneuraminic acid synthetase [Bacteroidales bacterium]